MRQEGGSVLFLGDGDRLLIGPEEERCDLVMLVKQKSSASFLSFASKHGYLAGIGHRLVAIDDSRLLPLTGVAIGPGGQVRNIVG